MTGGKDLYTGFVGGGRAGDLLGHGGLLEFLLVLVIDGSDLLTDELGLFDSKLFVGLELDFTSFLEGFLTNEGGHLLQLGSDLEGFGTLVYCLGCRT